MGVAEKSCCKEWGYIKGSEELEVRFCEVLGKIPGKCWESAGKNYLFTCKLTSELVTALWILPEDIRCLGTRQRTFITHGTASCTCLCGFAFFLQVTRSQVMTQVGLSGCLLMWYVALWGAPSSGSLTFIAIGRKPDICPGEDIVSSFKAFGSKHNSERWPR